MFSETDASLLLDVFLLFLSEVNDCVLRWRYKGKLLMQAQLQ